MPKKAVKKTKRAKTTKKVSRRSSGVSAKKMKAHNTADNLFAFVIIIFAGVSVMLFFIGLFASNPLTNWFLLINGMVLAGIAMSLIYNHPELRNN